MLKISVQGYLIFLCLPGFLQKIFRKLIIVDELDLFLEVFSAIELQPQGDVNLRHMDLYPLYKGRKGMGFYSSVAEEDGGPSYFFVRIVANNCYMALTFIGLDEDYLTKFRVSSWVHGDITNTAHAVYLKVWAKELYPGRARGGRLDLDRGTSKSMVTVHGKSF